MKEKNLNSAGKREANGRVKIFFQKGVRKGGAVSCSKIPYITIVELYLTVVELTSIAHNFSLFYFLPYYYSDSLLVTFFSSFLY